MKEDYSVRVKRELLEQFCTSVFETLGSNSEEALDSAKILVSADARGIQSHGVGRLWRYVNGIQKRVMKTNVSPTIIQETPLSLVLDANGAMGMSLSKRSMMNVIGKAQHLGVAFCSVRNSNHFGIAGYYSEMAATSDMIGITMTNTAALGVPTFGTEALVGTNPIAISVPATNNRIFTLDMSTTCVTRGKIEVYNREGVPLPEGWAVDTNGEVTTDSFKLLDDMLFQRGGGILPLGGVGELHGGYKGFGLGVLVDIFSAVTSGGKFGKHVKDSEATSARVCHFFGAIKIDLFRNIDDFKKDMGHLLDDINNTRPSMGSERVYYAGQKEREHEKMCETHGVPLTIKVYEQLIKIGKDLNIDMRF